MGNNFTTRWNNLVSQQDDSHHFSDSVTPFQYQLWSQPPIFHICFHPARHPIGDSRATIQITSKPVKTLKFTAHNGPFRKNIAQIFIMYITIPSWLVMIQQPQVRSSEEIPQIDGDVMVTSEIRPELCMYLLHCMAGHCIALFTFVCQAMQDNAMQCTYLCMHVCMCVCAGMSFYICKCM